MSVETTNIFSGPYLTNGATTSFPFSFRAMDGAEVAVIARQIANDVVISPGLYSVSLTDSGGTVEFASPPASGQSLILLSDPDFTQGIEFENGSRWLAEPVNEANDRHAVRLLAVKNRADRSIGFPIGEAASAQLPPAGGRAGTILGFDGLGNVAVLTPAELGFDINSNFDGGVDGADDGDTFSGGLDG